MDTRNAVIVITKSHKFEICGDSFSAYPDGRLEIASAATGVRLVVAVFPPGEWVAVMSELPYMIPVSK